MKPAVDPRNANVFPCTHDGCSKPARVAFTITRPTRPDLRITVYSDDRIAPKKAARECKEHGIASINALLDVVIDLDD